MKRNLLYVSTLIFLFFLLSKAGAQTNQTVVNGAPATAVNFTGGCLYHWVNSNPGIGLAASGTGNISSFTAINSGTSPIVATVTATPVGYAYVPNYIANTVSVVNLATNAIVAAIPGGNGPLDVAASADGTRVYISNYNDGTVSVINTATNTVVSTITLGVGAHDYIVGIEPQGIAISPDGSRVYVAVVNPGLNAYVSVINTATSLVADSILVPSEAFGISVTPDGSEVYIANFQASSVSVISTATDAIIKTIPVGANPYGLAISADGSKVYVANYSDGTVSVINTASNTVMATITIGSGTGPNGVALSPDGSRLYVSNGNGTVSVVNTTTRTVIATVPVGSGPLGISVSPDNSQVYVADNGGSTVSVISVATDMVTATIQGFSSPNAVGNFVIEGPGCSPVTFTITVNPSPAITPNAATGAISACAGSASASPFIQQFTVAGTYLTGNITATAPTGFEVSLNATSGYGGSITLTQTGGSLSNTVVYVRSAASAASGTMTGNVTLSSPTATSQDVAVTGIVTPLVAPSVSIAASTNNICAGAAVTFTATPTNGGAAPIFQWVLNGSNTGTNSATFSSSTLSNGDVINCSLTSNAACATPATATSNTITMNVAPLVTPSVSITASVNNICAGTPVTFTATTANGGAAPGYQWMLNGSNTGTNSATFSSSTLSNGDMISCMLTSNATCATPATATALP